MKRKKPADKQLKKLFARIRNSKSVKECLYYLREYELLWESTAGQRTKN